MTEKDTFIVEGTQSPYGWFSPKQVFRIDGKTGRKIRVYMGWKGEHEELSLMGSIDD